MFSGLKVSYWPIAVVNEGRLSARSGRLKFGNQTLTLSGSKHYRISLYAVVTQQPHSSPR